VVIDMDATIITAASKKQGAAAAWKKSFGLHPPAAWCANTCECVAMLPRAGNAGPNTAAHRLRVLRIKQDASLQQGCFVAALTGLNRREG
jgi:hypothetical protein